MRISRFVGDELDITFNTYYRLCEGAPSSEDTSQCESKKDGIQPTLIVIHDILRSMHWVFTIPADSGWLAPNGDAFSLLETIYRREEICPELPGPTRRGRTARW